MNKNLNIANRLREFGDKHFSSMAQFALALDMSPQNLNKYLSGASAPGAIIQNRLREYGCDIEWLMTGKKKEELEHLDNTIYQIPIFEYIKAGGKSMVLREEPAEYLHTTLKDNKNLLFSSAFLNFL